VPHENPCCYANWLTATSCLARITQEKALIFPLIEKVPDLLDL